MADIKSFRWPALGLVLLMLIGVGATFQYTARNLGINTDTVDMIADELPFRQAYERYHQGLSTTF